MPFFFKTLLITLIASFSLAVCPSAETFKKSFEFLSSEPWADLPLNYRIQTSHKITQGCHGAFDRFRKISILLQKSGVDIKSTLNSSIEFAKLSDQQTESFVATFKKIFLAEYFNFDFESSFKLSLEFAKESKDSTQILREDFLDLVRFCMKENGPALSIKVCANHAIEVVRNNRPAVNSILADWKNCYIFLQSDKRLGLSIKQTLEELAGLLKGGPGSCENFKASFDYAINSKNLELNPRAALDIAKLVSLSSKEPSQKSDEE